jgi:hypothetical protein
MSECQWCDGTGRVENGDGGWSDPCTRCTGWTATWCPVHGDCTCPRREDGEVEHNEGDRICPLHDEHNSTHSDDLDGRSS